MVDLRPAEELLQKDMLAIIVHKNASRLALKYI